MGQESDILGVSEGDTVGRAGHPVLSCRKVLGSFWACAKPGKTHQDRTGERGRNGSTPGGRVR